MKNLILLIVATLILGSCKTKDEGNWTLLLDKELTHWDRYLSYKHKQGYDGTIPKDENGNDIQPIGLNAEGYDVFTVSETENEPVLKVSGEIYGCVITKQEYENYHFRLQVKWGDKKYDPRKNLLKDSGILYHSVGPLGAEYWRSWMMGQEFQIMEGHMGDYWSQVTSAIDIRAYLPEYIMNPVAHKSQPFLSMGQDEEIQGFCLRSNNYENKHGEWNTLELVCFENKILHIVNGHVVMVLQNSRYVKNGESIPLNKGKIQLQSEATEVFYKDIAIQPLEKLPAKYALYFKE